MRPRIASLLRQLNRFRINLFGGTAWPVGNVGEPAPRAANARPTILVAMPFITIGGAERVVSQVVEHLVAAEFEVHMLTTEAVPKEFGDTTPWFTKSIDRVHHLPRLMERDKWSSYVLDLIERRGIDIIWLMGSAYIYQLLPDIKAQFPSIRVADMLFNTVGHVGSNRQFKDFIDLNIAEGQNVYQWLRDQGEPTKRVELIPNGVDVDRFHPRPKPTEVLARLPAEASRRFIAGYAGRFSEEKDPLLFVQLAEATADLDGLMFLMIGGGPMEAEVVDRINSVAKSDQIHFAGMRMEDTPDYLACFDVLILPSRLDGRPNVVMECLALGIPVISTDVGALPEMVQDGVNGYICKSGDVETFSERLWSLVNNFELYSRMKMEARNYAVRHLDRQNMLVKFETTFQALYERW